MKIAVSLLMIIWGFLYGPINPWAYDKFYKGQGDKHPFFWLSGLAVSIGIMLLVGVI